MNKLDINKIKSVPLNAYLREKTKKTQVYLHHSVSNGTGEQVLAYFKQMNNYVATHFAIGRDGTIAQGYNTDFWAYHLAPQNAKINLDRISVGIEIVALGALVKKGDKFIDAYGKEVKKDEVVTLEKPFRGSLYFHKYTDAQIESTRQILVYLNEKFGIPLDYDSNIFEISQNALNGVAGIYTHCSVRSDKSDIFPQVEMVNMLKNLKLKIEEK